MMCGLVCTDIKTLRGYITATDLGMALGHEACHCRKRKRLKRKTCGSWFLILEDTESTLDSNSNPGKELMDNR